MRGEGREGEEADLLIILPDYLHTLSANMDV